MKATVQPPIVYKSISELMRELGMPKPVHPLVALVSYNLKTVSCKNAGRNILIDFYKVAFRRNFKGQVKYGQNYYDFEEGGLAFLAPNQLVTVPAEGSSYDGYTLYFHPDLIRNYPLGKKMRQYGFFSYAVNEALFLSDKEKQVVAGLFESIATELNNNTDRFSQDILVSLIELLLNHSNRFYNRQFLTRKNVHNDLITKMDDYLAERFDNDTTNRSGIPTVQELSDYLRVSPRYLTDMLKSLTGQSAQQHIHDRLIEKAKAILSTSTLSIAEVAYRLGFEHPPSFNKLFKRSTNMSPKAFRLSFN